MDSSPDGPSLIFVMSDEDTKDMLLRFSQTCKAVVCCRVSPDQKRLENSECILSVSSEKCTSCYCSAQFFIFN